MGVLAVFLMGLVACEKEDMSNKRRGSKKGSKSMAQSEQIIELEIEAVSGK